MINYTIAQREAAIKVITDHADALRAAIIKFSEDYPNEIDNRFTTVDIVTDSLELVINDFLCEINSEDVRDEPVGDDDEILDD